MAWCLAVVAAQSIEASFGVSRRGAVEQGNAGGPDHRVPSAWRRAATDASGRVLTSDGFSIGINFQRALLIAARVVFAPIHNLIVIEPRLAEPTPSIPPSGLPHVRFSVFSRRTEEK